MPNKLKSFFCNKYFTSFALGSISAAAFAPLYFFPLAIIAFSGLFLILKNDQTRKESFWIGWCFGFGQFVFGIYWICISLFVDIERFFWLLPFALFALPAYFAIYVGFATLATNFISRKFNLEDWRKILILAVFWTIGEMLRSVVFTGFPWNLLGYSFLFSLAISQIASIIGIYGLSLFAVISYTYPALFFRIENKKIKFGLEKNSKLFVFFVASAIVAVWLFGSIRFASFKEELHPNATFRLVQPSIKQEYKWNPRTKHESFLEHIKLSNQEGFENVNYVIWSESAVPYSIDESSLGLLSEISLAAPQNGFVITGGIKVKFKNGSRELEEVWNSVFAINNTAQIVDNYDKSHLVPFGEYVPFSEYLPFVSKITDGSVNFSEGDGAKTIRLNDSSPSFSPLVCYEGIFSNNVINKKDPPQFLLNLTNDAWFGISSGPYQHFDMTRMRSIEYGMPLIRVANNGISGLTNPVGKIVASMPLNHKGIIDVKLMKNLPETFYAKYQNKVVFLIGFLLLIIVFARRSIIKLEQN